MFSSIGGSEILLILVVALVVLGPDHLPKAMRSLGRAVGQMRRVSTEFQRTLHTELDTPPQTSEPETSTGQYQEPEIPPHQADAAGQTVEKKRRSSRRAGIKRKTSPSFPRDRATSPLNDGSFPGRNDVFHENAATPRTMGVREHREQAPDKHRRGRLGPVRPGPRQAMRRTRRVSAVPPCSDHIPASGALS